MREEDEDYGQRQKLGEVEENSGSLLICEGGLGLSLGKAASLAKRCREEEMS